MVIVCVVIAVRLKQANTLESLIAEVAFTLSMACIFVVIITAANVMCDLYETSNVWLWKLRWAVDPDRSKYTKKVWKSFRQLRIQIAGLYHMESQAKLTLADFILSQSVNLLLIFE